MRTTIRSTTPSWATQLAASARLSPEAAWAVICPTRCALQRLLDEVGSADDLLNVAMGFNLAWVRVEGASTDAMRVFERAGAAIHTAEGRGDHGPLVFNGTERFYVLEAINLYDTVIRQSSATQLQQAVAAVKLRLTAEAREAA